MSLEEAKVKKYVLVIDDDASTAAFVQGALQYHDFVDTLIAYDGQEGLELYKKFQPELVITDIVMPKMNGIELINSLQKEPRPPCIWAITGSCSISIMDDLKKLLEGQVILKPFDFEDIDRLLRETFGN